MKLERISKEDVKEEVKYKGLIKKEELEDEMKDVYKRNKIYFNVPGFRKGKAPYEIVLKFYGPEVLLEDAFANFITTKVDEEVKEELGHENVIGIVDLDVKDEKIEYGKDITIELTIAMFYDQDIKDYKDVKIDKKELEKVLGTVESKENDMIEEELTKNSRNVTVEDKDYKIKEGDIAEISFAGYVETEDGKEEQFDGGTSEHHSLKIGSGSFIDGFEEQLIGLKKGDKKDVIVTFPEDYMSKELEGKEAKFKVEILDITQVVKPELDDEFAKDIGFDDLKEYKDYVNNDVVSKYNKAKEAYVQNEAIKIIAEKNDLKVSESFLTNSAENEFNKIRQQYLAQGFDIMNLIPNLDEAKEEMKENQRQQVYTELIARNIARQEDIKVTKEEQEEALKEYNEQFKVDITEEELKKHKEIKEDIERKAKFNKALKLINENVKIK